MKSKITVLITGCGRHSKGIIESLKSNQDNVKVAVIGVNNNDKNMLKDGLDKSYLVPSITSVDYIPTLLEICASNSVDVIFPYITAELELMAKSKHLFESIGTKVSVSSYDSILIANNKIKLSEKFPQYMPKQFIAKDKHDVFQFARTIGYPRIPFCCKLSDKCGGAGFAIIDEKKGVDISLFNKVGVNRYMTIRALTEIMENNTGMELILQEYVSGIDYSVVALSDTEKSLYRLGYAGYQMEYGAVVNGEIVKVDQAYEIVDEVIRELQLEGNACFDFILKEDGSVVLLEVNPRINASLSFATEAGLNLVWLRCKQLLGEPLNENVKVIHGLKMSKHYEAKYYV